jgi:hypothetical protein
MVTNTMTPDQINDAIDAAYWASLPTPVQQLSVSGLSEAQYVSIQDSLIAQGYSRFLLAKIDVWRWRPCDYFNEQSDMGCTWQVPSTAIQLGQAGQYSLPNEVPQTGSLGAYPTTPPAGIATITIPPMAELLAADADVASLLATWWPPYNPPTPVPPAPTDPVGLQVSPGSNYYTNAAGVNENNYPNGSEFTDTRGTFVHQVTATPFGNESVWMILPATS